MHFPHNQRSYDTAYGTVAGRIFMVCGQIEKNVGKSKKNSGVIYGVPERVKDMGNENVNKDDPKVNVVDVCVCVCVLEFWIYIVCEHGLLM